MTRRERIAFLLEHFHYVYCARTPRRLPQVWASPRNDAGALHRHHHEHVVLVARMVRVAAVPVRARHR